MLVRLFALLSIAFLSGLLSCQKQKEAPVYRVIGEAFAGPNQLPLRQDVSLRSPVIATVQHGERLDILDRRRRYLQVRTKTQLIGWVDIRLLISAKQMEQLDELAKRYKDSPSMGRATVFDTLNIHTDPNRSSPTFLQIQEKEHFDIIGHRVVLRVPYQGETIEIDDDTPKVIAKKKRQKKEPAITPPPSPAAPKLPDNWLELSRSASEASSADSKPVPSKPMDDLALVRNKDGRVGWAVSNAIFLEVPDDVAQYAEGKRITAYFPMGEVHDDGKVHNHYLWTTQSQKNAPFEFDGLRLFTYNPRRHRYETAYRERNIRGFFPVLVSAPEFRIIVEDDSGKLWLKAYAFDGTRVKSLGKQPYNLPSDAPPVSTKAPLPPNTDTSLFDRLRKLFPGQD